MDSHWSSESAWQRAKRSAPPVTGTWTFAVSTALWMVILPTITLSVMKHSHASAATLVMGAVAAAAASALLIVLFFQFCVAPVRQRNDARIDLGIMRGSQDTQRHELETALDTQRHELDIALVKHQGALAAEIARNNLLLHTSRNELRRAIQEIAEECDLIRENVRLALAHGPDWTGQGWMVFGGMGNLAQTRPQAGQLAYRPEMGDLHRLVMRVFRLVEEIHSAAYVLSGRSGGNRTLAPGLDIQVLFTDLDTSVNAVIPMLNAALKNVDDASP